MDTIRSSTKKMYIADLIGQEIIKQSLRVNIASAKQQKRSLPHMLFCGSPEMGKSTFANAVANEMGVPIRIISGSALRKSVEIVTLLTNLRAGEMLLVEQVEEVKNSIMDDVLMPAIANFSLEIVIGKGASERKINIKLPAFTFLGTATSLKKVDRRLLHLMNIYELVPYDTKQIAHIMYLLALKQGIMLDLDTTKLLIEHCEGCPGNAAILLRRVHDYAIAFADGQITSTIVKEALVSLGYERSHPNSVGLTDRLSLERQPIPDNVKIFVWNRDGGKCVKCGSREKLEYDHIIPISRGGSNTARNLQLLCETCNRIKGANII